MQGHGDVPGWGGSMGVSWELPFSYGAQVPVGRRAWKAQWVKFIAPPGLRSASTSKNSD